MEDVLLENVAHSKCRTKLNKLKVPPKKFFKLCLPSLPTFILPFVTEVVLVNRDKLFKANLSIDMRIYFCVYFFYYKTFSYELHTKEV